MAQQVLELAGLPKTLPARDRRERLDSTFYPIHANYQRALRLKFRCPEEFTIRRARYSPRRAVSAFFRYYAAHPALVALNTNNRRAA
jgi:hypothetical protein